MGYSYLHAHFARVASVDSEVGEMCGRHRHQCHVAKNTVGCPIVVVVEIAASESRNHTHGNFLHLRILVDVGRDVEDGSVIGRTP